MSDADPGERSFAAIPTPERESRPVAERRARRGWFDLPDGALGVFFLLLLAAVSGGLIGAYWPVLFGGADSANANDRIAALETRVGQMASGQAPKAAAATFQDVRRDMGALGARVDADEARLMALEKSAGDSGTADVPTGPAPNLGAVAQRLNAADRLRGDLRRDLEARIGALGNRIAMLERNAPPADLLQELAGFASKSDAAALDGRIARLEGADVEGVMRRAAAVLALANLIRATRGAEPFAAELTALRPLVGPAPQMDDLARRARGAPTAVMLDARLAQDAGAIAAAEREAQAKSWLEKFWANLTSVVSVRRIDGGDGKDTESRLARAQRAMRVGDLPRAVGEMKALAPAPRAAAKDWIAGAEARLAIERDITALSGRIVTQLIQPPARQAP